MRTCIFVVPQATCPATTTYLGNVERIVSSSKPSEIEWKRSVAGVLFTYKTNTSNQIQSTDKRFVFTDHLGSVDVITDAAGIIRHSLSFDAWGARRNGENWTAQDISQIIASLSLTGFTQPITTRGYTGHEMVDDMDIIYMTKISGIFLNAAGGPKGEPHG